MEKKLEDYLHFHLGCDCLINDTNIKMLLSVSVWPEKIELYFNSAIERFDQNINSIKPILRPIDSMTEDEDQEYDYIGRGLNYYEANALKTAYLLHLHFDLFNLIEAGLAIDATTLKKLETDIAK